MRIIPCSARFFPSINNVLKWSNKSNSNKELKTFVDNHKSHKKHKHKK